MVSTMLSRIFMFSSTNQNLKNHLHLHKPNIIVLHYQSKKRYNVEYWGSLWQWFVGPKYTFSLKIWRRGKSSLPFILGRAETKRFGILSKLALQISVTVRVWTANRGRNRVNDNTTRHHAMSNIQNEQKQGKHDVGIQSASLQID
ncbi:hypothetical protein Sjap_019553 [Stephania japonica]|uniref:Uncharacterized protein n=1 Tax=Stephania japonica TaxID=461633 RepID=A0AAP0HZU3_9MAGN